MEVSDGFDFVLKDANRPNLGFIYSELFWCRRLLIKLRFVFVSRRHQSDGLLGGQPQLRANLRGSQSPQRQTAKSSLEEELKKLITLDSPPPTTNEEKVQRNTVHSSLLSGDSLVGSF